MLRHTLCIWQRGFGSVSGQCQSAKRRNAPPGAFFSPAHFRSTSADTHVPVELSAAVSGALIAAISAKISSSFHAEFSVDFKTTCTSSLKLPSSRHPSRRQAAVQAPIPATHPPTLSSQRSRQTGTPPASSPLLFCKRRIRQFLPSREGFNYNTGHFGAGNTVARRVIRPASPRKCRQEIYS